VTGSRFEARPILRVRSPVIGRGEQVFELGTAPVTIGRADDCDIVLLEQSASRIHARVLPLPEGWEVVDEDSHGGIWLNGTRITAHRLADGDVVRIGDSEIQYVVRPAAQPTVIGSTRPAAASAPLVDVAGSAPTLGTPQPRAVPPVVAPSAPAPPAPAPRVAAARVAPPPPASAPSFVDFGPVGRPDAPQGSAPSFFDMGPVGQPGPQPSAPSFFDMGGVAHPNTARPPSFTGELADDASRMERRERSNGSKLRSWIILVLVFVGLSVGVAVMAFDITWADIVGVFQR
jgi:predicted component of type VI protein secretion system